jgi:hypothetical protein
MAWAQGKDIKLVKLAVNDGNIVPILPTTVYSINWDLGASVDDVELSFDGQTIYFAEERNLPEGGSRDYVGSVSIASCSSNCAAQVFYTALNTGMGWLSISPTGDRLYMSIHDRVPNIRTVSFMQKQSGVWSPLQHVVSNRDAAYSDVSGLAATALGSWDYDGSGTAQDVLAFTVERSPAGGVDVIDVSNCVVGSAQSCYGSGVSSLVRVGIAGSNPSFTSIPTSTDLPPNLLISSGVWRDNNELTSEVDLDSMLITPLVIGLNPDSAD